MALCATRWRVVSVKALLWLLTTWFLFALLASDACAQEITNDRTAVNAPQDEPGFVVQLIRNLLFFDSRELLKTLRRPEFTLAAFVSLNLIVFVETGLFFFLPGDSLLVTAGMAASFAGWNVPLLLTTLCLSAIVGDSVGYWIGWKTGPKIFDRQNSWCFRKEHLVKAHAFYEKHGGKTIVLARFMPIVRTFAPIVAGVAQMNYRRFLCFNIIGGISWVVSMILIGYTLTESINPAVRLVLGNPDFDVQDHIEKVVIVVVLLSISPAIFVWLKTLLRKKSPPPSQAISSPELLKVE